MEPEVHVEPRARGQEGSRQVEGDAVEVHPEETPQPGVPMGHQRQGCEKVLAELAVGDPRRSLPVGFEGERVDQDRSTPMILNVVRARVLERHSEPHRGLLHPQRREGRVLELTERPLIGVGDEGDALGSQGEVSVAAFGFDPGRLLVGNQQVLAGELGIESGAHQLLVVGRVAPVDLSVDHARALEDEPAGIAKGGAEDPVAHSVDARTAARPAPERRERGRRQCFMKRAPAGSRPLDRCAGGSPGAGIVPSSAIRVQPEPTQSTESGSERKRRAGIRTRRARAAIGRSWPRTTSI